MGFSWQASTCLQTYNICFTLKYLIPWIHSPLRAIYATFSLCKFVSWYEREGMLMSLRKGWKKETPLWTESEGEGFALPTRDRNGLNWPPSYIRHIVMLTTNALIKSRQAIRIFHFLFLGINIGFWMFTDVQFWIMENNMVRWVFRFKSN